MMEYKGYIGKVEFDDEVGLFHGEVINLRDVITFAGETVQEAQLLQHRQGDEGTGPQFQLSHRREEARSRENKEGRIVVGRVLPHPLDRAAPIDEDFDSSRWEVMRSLGVIRFRRHLSKGEYDAEHVGRAEEKAAAEAELFGRVQGGRGATGAGRGQERGRSSTQSRPGVFQRTDLG